jgi:hypothetical protein
MNIVPVAYINVEERKLEWAEPIVWHTPTIAKMDKIPLYTHPVKEQDTECQYCKQGCIRCDARKQLTDEEIAQEWSKFYPDVFHTHLIDFARAILRKAQEK